MTATAPKPASTRPMTPLWVISLFITLTETVLGIGVFKTTGGIQIALTVFVLVFPLLIAGVFFAILWNKPYVLYPPNEYAQMDIQKYVDAMQGGTPDQGQLYLNIQNTIRSELQSSKIVNQLTEVVSNQAGRHMEDKVSQILASVANRTIETIREESFLTIDIRQLVGEKGEIWQIPYNRYKTVSELLDNTWYLLTPYKIPSLSYGERWVFRERQTGRILRDMGRRWARKQGHQTDWRILADVGIVPGMWLDAIPLKESD